MVASFIELIEKKRDGETLNEEDIELFVNGVTNGEMKDHQLGKCCEILLWSFDISVQFLLSKNTFQNITKQHTCPQYVNRCHADGYVYKWIRTKRNEPLNKIHDEIWADTTMAGRMERPRR